MATKSGFTESYFECPDGGSLYFRSYGSPKNQPVLCMHGLTRNANDFHQLAQYLQPSFYVISVDQRGRARSSYLEDPMAYSPETYLSDMTNLISHLGFKKVYLIGTSMGGFMAMTMAAFDPTLFPKIVLNDCGPEIGSTGVNNIASYLGKGEIFKSKADAFTTIQQRHMPAFPNFSNQEWNDHIFANMKENKDGSWQFDYDQNIKVLFEAASPSSTDLWPIWELITSKILLFKGELSTLLSRHTLKKMHETKSFKSHEISGIGHTPTLNTQFEQASILNFLL